MGSDRVVDEGQAQPRAVPTVAQAVQRPQGLNRLVVHPLTALFGDVLLRVARQAGDDFDAHPGQKLGQIFLAGLEQDGQVTAVDDPAAGVAQGLHRIPKRRVQLGCAAGDIDRVRTGRVDQLQRPVER